MTGSAPQAPGERATAAALKRHVAAIAQAPRNLWHYESLQRADAYISGELTRAGYHPRRQVYEVAGPQRVPIIGQGGITTASDAIEFMIAGASAVGVGTALFYDPLVCGKINSGIAAYLHEHGMKSVTALVGSLRTGNDTQDTPLAG